MTTEHPDNHLGSCHLCGKPFREGDRAYATTAGTMRTEGYGFVVSSDDDWLTIACTDCGALLVAAIGSVEIDTDGTKRVHAEQHPANKED